MGIMELPQVLAAKELVRKAATVIFNDLKAKNIELLDMSSSAAVLVISW